MIPLLVDSQGDRAQVCPNFLFPTFDLKESEWHLL